MHRERNIDKRIISFRNSDSPLTSERVSVMLSNSEDAAKLANAVRSLRNNKHAAFTLSDAAKKEIEKRKRA